MLYQYGIDMSGVKAGEQQCARSLDLPDRKL
jgi:hypothetical protein